MHIALIAHDSKKELMIQFCIAYCGILNRHSLCATATTGKLISEATGLKIQRYLSGPQGGDQQIASRIGCDEIDLLLFFRDPLTKGDFEPTTQIFCAFATFTTFPSPPTSPPPRCLFTASSAATWIGATSSTPSADKFNLSKANAVPKGTAFFMF